MITSTSNSQVKEIRKLKDKKYRSETGLFFVEGTRIVIEALEETPLIQMLIVARELLKTESAVNTVRLAEQKKIEILEVNSEVFSSISSKEGPQGLAAIIKQDWKSLEDLGGKIDGIWIALNEVADPGNLGTIIRTLDGMAGKGVILIDHCTDPYDPSSIRASMGAVFSKKLIKTDSQSFMNWVTETNTAVIGTSDAEKTDYTDFTYPQNMILLMGSEREGLSRELTEICRAILAIPMNGKADSLNLAVASSIMLYTIYNQHRKR